MISFRIKNHRIEEINKRIFQERKKETNKQTLSTKFMFFFRNFLLYLFSFKIHFLVINIGIFFFLLISNVDKYVLSSLEIITKEAKQNFEERKQITNHVYKQFKNNNKLEFYFNF